MVKERSRVAIEIDATSDLARALRDDDAQPVILVSDGIEYDVVRLGGSLRHADKSERLRAALQPAPGIFSPEEAEELKQNIYKWREAGTRPIGRP
jgi:hypothetical protein